MTTLTELDKTFLENLWREKSRNVKEGTELQLFLIRGEEFDEDAFISNFLLQLEETGRGIFSHLRGTKVTIHYGCERQHKATGQTNDPSRTRSNNCPAYISFVTVNQAGRRAVVIHMRCQHSGHDPQNDSERRVNRICQEVSQHMDYLVKMGKKSSEILLSCAQWAEDHGHHDATDRRFYPTHKDIKYAKSKQAKLGAAASQSLQLCDPYLANQKSSTSNSTRLHVKAVIVPYVQPITSPQACPNSTRKRKLNETVVAAESLVQSSAEAETMEVSSDPVAIVLKSLASALEHDTVETVVLTNDPAGILSPDPARHTHTVETVEVTSTQVSINLNSAAPADHSYNAANNDVLSNISLVNSDNCQNHDESSASDCIVTVPVPVAVITDNSELWQNKVVAEVNSRLDSNPGGHVVTRHRVTMAEMSRRCNPPESMSMSTVCRYLRFGKDQKNKDYVTKIMDKVGRPKKVGTLSSFTLLTEGDIQHLAADMKKIASEKINSARIARCHLQDLEGEERIKRGCHLIHARDMLKGIIDSTLSSDDSKQFDLSTHGGTLIIKAVGDILSDILDKEINMIL